MGHRFADARNYLAKASVCKDLSAATERLSLGIDQACGTRLESVFDARRRMAAKSGRLEDLVPLAALHADLREFDEADRIYQRALKEYRGTSPFAVGLGLLSAGCLVGRTGSRVTIEPGRGMVSKGD